MSPLLLALALGAGGAFLLDPQHGRRRRALLRSMRGGPVSDDVLVGRVRARLGRCVSHPHAIRVAAQNGYVTLSGEVLQPEHAGLLAAVHSVKGVRDVMDRLDVHAGAEGVPSLQGGAPPARERPEILQRTWSPGTRALVGGTGALLAVYALARGGALGVAALAGGAAMIARAKANRPLWERESGPRRITTLTPNS